MGAAKNTYCRTDFLRHLSVQVTVSMEAEMASNEERIRQRAYEIWEREGRPHGEDMKHWLQAFQEIAANAQTDNHAVKKPRGKKAEATAVAQKPRAKTKTAPESVSTTNPPPARQRTARGATRH
ncbi:DUF2934 domain-containing protein [Rhizobium sp. BK650]|uniref:DUF2934 domain-containing protein n=1 Tax=Rhizobium sp. BK650 TaxID=2586990 RepID=UPI0028B0225A|nr:DUF2934 domain-containing protein [Rhizobium sp. BK650]